MYIAKLVMTLGMNRTVFYPEKWMLHNRKEKCKCDKAIIYCKYLQLPFLCLFVISAISQMFSMFWNDSQITEMSWPLIRYFCYTFIPIHMHS